MKEIYLKRNKILNLILFEHKIYICNLYSRRKRETKDFAGYKNTNIYNCDDVLCERPNLNFLTDSSPRFTC